MSAESHQQALTWVVTRGGAEDWYRLGCELHDLGRHVAAVGCFARVVERDSSHHRGWTNYGWSLHLAGRSEEAARALNRAIELAPREATPHGLLSQVYLTLGADGLALSCGERGVGLEPGLPINQVAYAMALMSAGEWKAGWERYEHRFAYKIPEFLTRPYRLWRGERVGHLYVEAEQGAGDVILVFRWLPAAAELAERVTLYVHGSLYALCEELWVEKPGNVSVYPLPRPLPGEVEAWSPMLSLPVALGFGGPEEGGAYIHRHTVLDEIIAKARDQKDGADRIQSAKEMSAALDAFHQVWSRPSGCLRIGICWAGSAQHEQARHRDCGLEHWLRLAEVPGVELHSLQVGDGARQMGELGAWGLVLDRGPEITNFADTARVMAGLDLVVSVDTAVAHLAGAMGVPCWMLFNRRGKDFRWPYEGERTAWYSSMRLFHRGLDEGWDAVIRRVEGELRGMVG